MLTIKRKLTFKSVLLKLLSKWKCLTFMLLVGVSVLIVTEGMKSPALFLNFMIVILAFTLWVVIGCAVLFIPFILYALYKDTRTKL